MTRQEKIQIVKENRSKLTAGQKRAFGDYKSMIRNIAEEGGRIGGESHVSPKALAEFDNFLDKRIAGL